MKRILSAALIVSALLYSSGTRAQEFTKGQPGMYPEAIDFKNLKKSFQPGAVIIADSKGNLAVALNTRIVRSEKDAMGMVHYRYQQTYKGIPVENAEYVLHVSGSDLRSQNGKWVKDFPAQLPASAAISFDAALSRAKSAIGAISYKWEVPGEEAFIKRESNNASATFFPKKMLVYYSGPTDVVPAKMRLAYKMDIYAHYPSSRRIIYIDALDGTVLGENMITKHTNATGTAVTAYSGTQSITTDYTGTTYRLRETGRGNGIQTLNMKTAGTNYNNAVDFTDADNNWNNVNTNKDQYATDAHWAAEKTYDYFFLKYNRNSIDNAGFALKSYVHVSLTAQGYPDNINAFWDGSRMSYGDGGSGYSPLTALDIAGHEITHGLTENSSNLNYVGESGAMNEGFSDIFGTCIEFYARPSRANWNIGEDIGAAFRSMSNPKQFSQPNTYTGTYWKNSNCASPSNSNDYCGVHTNSGVLNYWFYLLSQGGSGTNDLGSAYNVTGLGIDKAGAIAFRTNTVYLISTSKFADARTYSIKSAEDLYGVGSAEALTTACAWAAVGVGTCTTGTTCTAPSGLATSAVTASGATLSWTAVSGAASYVVEYKTAAASTWTTAAAASTGTSVTLSGLTASTAYNWRVKTTCSASSSSAYTTANFTTTAGTVTCNAPSGLASSAITSSGATVSWVAVSGAGSYLVEYKTSASSTWLTAAAATTATSVTLTGLTASTAYDWRVKTTCSASSSSAYSAAAFTTSAVATGCSTAYEANGTQATAATIATNTAISAAISPANDVDYYKVVTTATGSFSISLSNLAGDYDLYFYNSAGTQIGSSTKSGTTAESIALTSQAAGTYYVRVIGYSGANSATVCYSLTVNATAVTGCQSSYDVTTNGTTSGAAAVPLNTNITGLISPSADIDNYKFVITTGGTITITLGTLPADYDLKLLNSSGTQVGISQNGNTTAESISYTAAAGTYYAQVYGYNGANSASTCYTLKVQTGTATIKENNAPVITKATLKLYPNPAVSAINVSLLGEINRQSVLQITDAKGILVKELRINGSIQSIDVSTLAKGVYFVKVLNGEEVITTKFVKQ